MATVDFAQTLKKFPKDQQKALLTTLKAAQSLFPKATTSIA